jgi:hypothetical protein
MHQHAPTVRASSSTCFDSSYHSQPADVAAATGAITGTGGHSIREYPTAQQSIHAQGCASQLVALHTPPTDARTHVHRAGSAVSPSPTAPLKR